MAYLDFVKSGGKVYVYVNQYSGNQKFTSKKEIRVARLGRTEQALMTLKVWQMNPERIPLEIDNDVHKRIPTWIQQVRDRVAF